MFNNFICPHCEGHMSIAGHIIFAGVKKKNNERGIILLNPKIGDYSRILHPGFKIDEGEDVEFLCPMCHKNLAAYDINEKLAHIIMLDENNDKHDIFFSEIAGEQCTFNISGKTIEKMGEDAEDYLDYFKRSDKYKNIL